MTYFNDPPKPTEPRRTAAVSSGQFESGSVFRLVREIRGSAYSVGDQFMLVESEDCHDPNTLVLGGVGENYFIDPRGKPLKIEAGDTQIDSIFELVREPQREVVEEIGAEDAPPRHVTAEQFKTFREGLAGVLNEIATVRSTGGERGERGPRGYTGVQGDKGDVGLQGPQGERGERGEKGEQGEQGERGEKGDTGERGPQGERGEPGPQGDRGEQGERGLQGERGEQGERGQRGEQGERGEAGAVGSQGPQGERGAAGVAGADGRDGAIGPRGERGEKGERGAEGKAGKAGAKGAKGEKGDKGDAGESGVVTAKFPLVYDAAEKSISIDEERLDKILKKILGGGKVSPQDMGWLASTGGGGKVAVYINGSKITPDVRTLDFTGAGVTASKVGGKVTVNFTGTGGGSSGGVASVNGLSGAIFLEGGTDISISPSGQTLTINYTGSSISNAVTSFNGITGAVTGVCAASAGTGISVSGSTGTVTITNTGVQSFNGNTGAVQGVSSWNGETGAVTFNNYVSSFNGLTGAVQGVSAAAAGTGIFVSAATGSVTITNTGVQSFNGLTGAVQGVSSWNGETGAVQFHNYVSAFNGRTGSVQGVSSANGLTGAVTWAAGTGLEISSGGGTITYGIGSGYALLRSVGNTAALDAIDNPSIGDLVFVQNQGTYYYWDYYAATGTTAWINISIISNALQGDLNNDGFVNGADLGVLLASWGSLYGNRSLNIGVQDGITGAFKVFADGSDNPKKQDMVVVSTEGATSEFRVNTDNLFLTGLTEINGENTNSVALSVINGRTELNGDSLVNGTLEIINGGLSGGFIDGGTFV